MKYFTVFIFLALLLSSCKNKLDFEGQTFEKKSHLPCTEICPHVFIQIPVAKGVPGVADRINQKVFSVIKLYVDPVIGRFYFERINNDSLLKTLQHAPINYESLLTTYINYLEKKRRENPDDKFPSKLTLTGNVTYQSDKIINIQLNCNTNSSVGNIFSARDYESVTSLIFDARTGKLIHNKALFKDTKAFTAFAEQKVRKKFKTLFRGEEEFRLPQNFLFTDKGLLLYYNRYEIDGRSDGTQELLLPFQEVEPYLITR